MRWLVTGGSGFLGINLVRHLLARGDHVTTLDREPFAYPERSKVTEIIGDIRDAAVVGRAVEGCDVVVHAAAALPLYPAEEIHSIDVDGTRTVLEATGSRRFIHLSSTAVYGVPDHHPLVEDDPMRGVDACGVAQVEAERVCLAARDAGRVVTILRPKSFVGPERLGVFGLLFEWANEGRDFPVLGSGENRFQLLDVEDLCAAIVLAGTIDSARVNDTFNLGAREFTSLREDVQAVLDAAGHARRVRSLPIKPAVWLLRRLDRAKLSPLYPWIFQTITHDSFVAIEKARTQLGWTPKYSNKAALVRNFKWYRAHAHALGPVGVTHRVPWRQGAIALAKLAFPRHRGAIDEKR